MYDLVFDDFHLFTRGQARPRSQPLILFSLDHMTTPRTLQLLAFSIFASYCSVGFAFGDPACSPCVLNGYRVAVGLVTTFGDGTSCPGSLPPGSDAWL